MSRWVILFSLASFIVVKLKHRLYQKYCNLSVLTQQDGKGIFNTARKNKLNLILFNQGMLVVYHHKVSQDWLCCHRLCSFTCICSGSHHISFACHHTFTHTFGC
jgi:hypothetical protein